jgi:hypothetical protein
MNGLTANPDWNVPDFQLQKFINLPRTIAVVGNYNFNHTSGKIPKVYHVLRGVL